MHMGIGSPEFSLLPFTFGLADFIAFPLKKTSAVSQIGWNNGKRRRKGCSKRDKNHVRYSSCQNSLKSVLFLEGSYL